MIPRFAKTVGVAPGTMTIQLTGINPRAILPPGGNLLPVLPDASDPKQRWMAYDRGMMTPSGGGMNGPAGVRAFDPYQDMAQLNAPITSAASHIRWDIVAIVGGGALGIALTAGLIASAFGRK